MAKQNVGESLLEILKDQAKEAGKELKDGGKNLALYINERTAVLAGEIGKPGYQDALIAERDNVVMKAASWAIDEADAFDQRFVTTVQSVLHVAVMAL